MTKTLEFKNSELAPVANFLQELNLKNLASRGRTKLIKLLATKNDEYSEDRLEALGGFFEADGTTLKKGVEKQAKEAADEVESEPAVVDFTEYSNKLDALYKALQEYNYELSNSDALLYDLLLDKLDEAFTTEKEGK